MSGREFSKERVNELKRIVIDFIDQNSERFFEISRFLYENPETGLKEFKTAEILSSELEKHGFKVTRGVAGMETAFLATREGKPQGPTLAILAEYDALPGVGHGCGHNIIGTSAIAAGIGLSRIMSELQGKLMVIGTPNEEGGVEGGKIRLLEAGAFKNVDAAIMIHPYESARANSISHPKLEESTPPMLALGAVEIRFKGKASHAAALPELGVNALDAVILTFVGLSVLRQQIRSDSRIHGIITQGGKAPNIIPDEAAAFFYVRARETIYMLELMEKLKGCAEGAAKATGATLEFKQNPRSVAAVRRNYSLSRLAESNLVFLGESVQEAEKKVGSASSDLGNVSEVVPSASVNIAIGPNTLVFHNREVAEASVSEAGKHGLLVGAKAMALSCIDLFTQPETLETVRKEFRSK